MKILSYLKGRCGERSSWVAIGGGITAASALTAPWSYAFLAIAVVGVMVPDAVKDAVKGGD